MHSSVLEPGRPPLHVLYRGIVVATSKLRPAEAAPEQNPRSEYLQKERAVCKEDPVMSLPVYSWAKSGLVWARGIVEMSLSLSLLLKTSWTVSSVLLYAN